MRIILLLYIIYLLAGVPVLALVVHGVVVVDARLLLNHLRSCAAARHRAANLSFLYLMQSLASKRI